MLCRFLKRILAHLRRWFRCGRRRPTRLNLTVDVVDLNEERKMKEAKGTAGLQAVRIVAKPRGGGAARQLEPGTFEAKSSDTSICADGVLVQDGTQDGDGNFVYELRAPMLSPGECDLVVDGDADPSSGQSIISESVHVTVLAPLATDLNTEVDVVDVTPAP